MERRSKKRGEKMKYLKNLEKVKFEKYYIKFLRKKRLKKLMPA